MKNEDNTLEKLFVRRVYEASQSISEYVTYKLGNDDFYLELLDAKRRAVHSLNQHRASKC